MTTIKGEATDARDESARNNRIVSIDADNVPGVYAAYAAELSQWCDGDVEYDTWDGPCHEFWGGEDHNTEWRVHVYLGRPE